MDPDHLLSERSRALDTSRIRRIFELSRSLTDPIDLSIGQPDFAVPPAIKQHAIAAIEADRNGYSLSRGEPALLEHVQAGLARDLGWTFGADGNGTTITSGTSGALLLICMMLLDPGDEAVIPDPYFVAYPGLVRLFHGTPITCDTAGDGRMTAERVEPLLTDRTKFVLVNSPANPTGVVLTSREMQDLVELCADRGVLLVSDEIYDVFTYDDARADGRCPSPGRFNDRCLVIRGFGKTYACTGWRLGYAAGPARLIDEMVKLQQYTFVCPPTPNQLGVVGALDVDMQAQVDVYQRRRDRVLEALAPVAEVTRPGGAFYAWIRVPETLGMGGAAFAEHAIERGLLLVPGSVFSERDTHVRLSFAVPEERLERGLALLVELLGGG